MTTTAMIVMEPGSVWPGHVGDVTSLVAFCEEGDELLRRTEAALHTLERGKRAVRVAVLACNAAADGQAASLRLSLARRLLGAVSGTTCGRLVVSASVTASRDLREALLVLVGALTEELRGTTTTVSLRFDGSPRRANLRPAAEARAMASTGTDG